MLVLVLMPVLVPVPTVLAVLAAAVSRYERLVAVIKF